MFYFDDISWWPWPLAVLFLVFSGFCVFFEIDEFLRQERIERARKKREEERKAEEAGSKVKGLYED